MDSRNDGASALTEQPENNEPEGYRGTLHRLRALRGNALLLLFAVAILLALGGWTLLQANPSPATGATIWQDSPSPALMLKREAGELWAAGQRDEALARWEEAHRLAPDNPDIRESLARAQVGRAADWLHAGEAERALPLLGAAYSLMPDEPAVLHEYQALLAYTAGRDAVAAREWGGAVEALEPLYRLDPGYLDVRLLLEQALAGQQQAEVEARARSEQAASVAHASASGQRLRTLLEPPDLSNQPGQNAMPSLGALAPASNKHIVVSINAQRMYVYENDQLIWDWVASTGEAGRPTVPGRYRIQSKFENARSNVWSLWMPYWQGIYWAGSVENGIHGQVTFDSGGRLWEGYLGTRITFGCVMISDEHAAILYNWTDIGTPISIHWDWQPGWIPDANGDPS